MWTATINKISRASTDKRLATIGVTYSNGTVSDDRTYTLSPASIESTLQGEIAQYEAVDAMIANPPTWAHPGGTITAPTPTTPTAQETAEAAWVAAYRRVQQLKRGVATGVAAITQAKLDGAVATLNALPYLDAYEARL